MRGAKVTPWIGGTRANSFWRWPGFIQPADCSSLTAHIDFFPTLAEIAGAKVSDSVKSQVEGRSLVPLLENPSAPWADRTLFTHVGRWPKFTDPNEWKYKSCSVRNSRWQLVSEKGAAAPKWELFDLVNDPSEKRDVSADHPKVVQELSQAFEQFWSKALPVMTNEMVEGPSINPYQEIYYQQFGGSPTEADLAKMAPKRKSDGKKN